MSKLRTRREFIMLLGGVLAARAIPVNAQRSVQAHSSTRNIGIISADIVRQNLVHDIRAHGLGFVRVRGSSIEDAGIPHEYGFLVIGKKGHDSGQILGFLRKHTKKYGTGVLYKQHNRPDAVWIGTSKTSHEPSYTFHPRQVGQYFSRLMGREWDWEFYSERSFFCRTEEVHSLEHIEKLILGEPLDEADEEIARNDVEKN